MYIPKQYEEKDIAEAEALVREFSFATLTSVVNGLPWATHIPLELVKNDNGDWLLHGHIARPNPQWRTLQDNPDVLAIFMGPHTYVSPSWYNHRNVPTWNYKAVHLYGKATIVEGEALIEMLRKLMARYENAHAKKPDTYDDIPADMLKHDLRGLVGLEIKVERIEAVSKLSQGRDSESYNSIVDHLKDMDAYDAKRIAKEVEKRKK